MSLESFSGGITETKSARMDNDNVTRFDPDKRMDINENLSSFSNIRLRLILTSEWRRMKIEGLN